jgi:DNA polymerase-3 subunit epsilon
MTAPSFATPDGPVAILETALRALDASGDYRVLRRFVPQDVYTDEPWNIGEKSSARLGLYLDTETTGLDTDADEIIELALVPFVYDAESGVVYRTREALSYLEEAKRPITPEIVEITGITPDMVVGQRIDDDAVNALVKDAAIIIAHSARFDRKMAERRLPCFRDKPWACSQEEVPWRRFGVAGGALLNIAMAACGVFTDGAHRAAHDCQLGVHVLATAEHEGRTAMSYLLESARQPTHRVRALYSPRDAKSALKARGYHALYHGDSFRYWYKDLRPDGLNVEQEMAWCEAYAFASPDVQLLTARDRYSVRANG